jgi:Mrp family chromosome partitioning ATPase
MNAIDLAFIRAYEADDSLRAEAASLPEMNATSTAATLSSPRAVWAEAQSHGADGGAPHFQWREEASKTPAAAGAASRERRPLSTFAKPGPTVEAHFKPALEVDQFRWSSSCEHLVYRHRDRLRPALLALLAADEAGRSLIGIGAPAAGVGCTTVLACLARLLADAGKSVAIVDGNFTAPGLAAKLGLAVEVGWEHVLEGGVPLAESVIYSLADRIALLPLVAGGDMAAEKLQNIHASVTAGVLRYHYDMVLFDLGAITGEAQVSTARRIARQCRLDGVVLTSGAAPATAVHPQRLMQTAPELASICLGVVENQLLAA